MHLGKPRNVIRWRAYSASAQTSHAQQHPLFPVIKWRSETAFRYTRSRIAIKQRFRRMCLCLFLCNVPNHGVGVVLVSTREETVSVAFKYRKEVFDPLPILCVWSMQPSSKPATSRSRRVVVALRVMTVGMNRPRVDCLAQEFRQLCWTCIAVSSQRAQTNRSWSSGSSSRSRQRCGVAWVVRKTTKHLRKVS